MWFGKQSKAVTPVQYSNTHHLFVEFVHTNLKPSCLFVVFVIWPLDTLNASSFVSSNATWQWYWSFLLTANKITSQNVEVFIWDIKQHMYKGRIAPFKHQKSNNYKKRKHELKKAQYSDSDLQTDSLMYNTLTHGDKYSRAARSMCLYINPSPTPKVHIYSKTGLQHTTQIWEDRKKKCIEDTAVQQGVWKGGSKLPSFFSVH